MHIAKYTNFPNLCQGAKQEHFLGVQKRQYEAVERQLEVKERSSSRI